MCFCSSGGRCHSSNRRLLKLLNSTSVSLTDRKQFCHNESHICICGFTQTLTATLPSVYLLLRCGFVVEVRRSCELFNCWWSRWRVEHRKLSSDDEPPTTERLFSFTWTLKNHRAWSIWLLPPSGLSASSITPEFKAFRKQTGKLNPTTWILRCDSAHQLLSRIWRVTGRAKDFWFLRKPTRTSSVLQDSSVFFSVWNLNCIEPKLINCLTLCSAAKLFN